MFYSDHMLWWVGHLDNKYFINITSTRTQIPRNDTLDLLAVFEITDGIEHEPSGIIIDEEKNIWLCDTGKNRIYGLEPRHDYFILDKDNRYVYFRENYQSGVFISNT